MACPSGKVEYKNAGAVMRALRALTRRKKGIAHPGFPYRCDACRAWHWTRHKTGGPRNNAAARYASRTAPPREVPDAVV